MDGKWRTARDERGIGLTLPTKGNKPKFPSKRERDTAEAYVAYLLPEMAVIDAVTRAEGGVRDGQH
jgi:hypothetical protein